MSTDRDQSAIAEVRDQLSLDFADGSHLNKVTANLGLNRPPFGFSDNTWRAVTKVLALQYKQIKTKFEDVLTAIFGTKETTGGTLAVTALVGSKRLILNDTSKFPQLGTLILDATLGSEETIKYCYIDRVTNTVYLDTPTTAAHLSYSEFDDNQPLVFDASAGSTILYLPRSIYLPTTYPVSVVVGRGTAVEETVWLVDNDPDTGRVEVSPALTNDHVGLTPTSIQSSLAVDYIPTAEFLVLEDSTKFPDTGYVLLGPSSTSFTAIGGTPTTVTTAVATFTTSRHIRHVLVFDGNVTATLAGVEAEVISNTTTLVTFKAPLPAAPVAGDTFSVRPLLRYTRNEYAVNALNLARDITDIDLVVGTEIELLEEQSTLLLAPVKMQGTGWDVIQVTPRLVELLIPPHLQDIRNLLSASYLHPTELALSELTATSTVIGDSVLTLSTGAALDFPPGGTVLIDRGGVSEEYAGYTKQRLESTYLATGSTRTTVQVAAPIFATAVAGQVVYFEDKRTKLTRSRTIASFTPTSITFVDPLSPQEQALFRDTLTKVHYLSSSNLVIPDTLAASHAVGEAVEYYEVVYAGTDLPSGNLWTDDNVWPGPYIYDIGKDAPQSTTTELNMHLAGPTHVAVGTVVGKTALEVGNAVSFPLGVVSPFQVLVGRNTGNRELVNVDDVNLSSRTSTTVAAVSVIGATALQVAALTGGGTADTFPDANGYRVLVGAGTANEEILDVSGTLSGPFRITLNQPATRPHALAESVQLLADVLSVDPLDDDHLGAIKFANKLAGQHPIGTTSPVTSVIDDNTITVANSSFFPSLGYIRLGQETYRYSKGPGTVLNILDFSGLRNTVIGLTAYVLLAQPVGELVEMLYESIDVDSTTGFSADGGAIILNFGKNILDGQSRLSAPAVATDTTLTVSDASLFPTRYPYEIRVGAGTANEERHLVTANDGVSTLTINSTAHGLKDSHPIGVQLIQTTGDGKEKLTYTSLTATSFRFSTPVMLQSSHSPSEVVLPTFTRSAPRVTGFDFPLRLPPDILFRLQFLLDLIRAAGVQVVVIEQR